MGIETEIAKEGREFTYQAIDRWGLPTFFVLIMFALCGFLAWLLYTNVKENAIQNTLKLEKIAEIQRATDDLKSEDSHIMAMISQLTDAERTWQSDHKSLEQTQMEILRRLDDGREPRDGAGNAH